MYIRRINTNFHILYIFQDNYLPTVLYILPQSTYSTFFYSTQLPTYVLPHTLHSSIAYNYLHTSTYFTFFYSIQLPTYFHILYILLQHSITYILPHTLHSSIAYNYLHTLHSSTVQHTTTYNTLRYILQAT